MKHTIEIAAFLLCALVLAGAGGTAATAPAGNVASCAAAKKALAAYKRKMAAQRTTYFKTHRATAARKAFLRKQRAKLRRLQQAAKRACQSACVRAKGAVADYKRQMAKQRKAFFKRNKNTGARRSFLKRQQSKLKRLQRAAASTCRTPGQTPPPQPPTPSPAPPQPPTPSPAPPPAPPAPSPADRDGDGYPNEQDCAPDNAAIYPGAADAPDLAFVDSNCDGIDGTESSAVFVSPLGNDGNPGTRAAPMREVSAGLVAAAAVGKQHVYVQGGTYGRVAVTVSDMRVYGGYSSDWSRSLASATSIVGEPEGMLLVTATDILLQNLTVRGNARAGTGESAYGIRLTENSSATLQRVFVSAGNGTNGVSRAAGASGGQAAGGGDGKKGACGDDGPRGGGAGGASAVGRAGGRGGDGGWFNGPDPGDDGGTGQNGTQGGAGGDTGDPGRDGGHGDDGADGSGGANGPGGTRETTLAATEWVGQSGAAGGHGTHGMGGGGGGGGGAQDVFPPEGWPGTGNGGGGGGAGGPRGMAAPEGGGPGGGSFGLYLHYSTVVVTDGSSITPGDGGTGGRGGAGGTGGLGGAGGLGAAECPDEVGIGGNGGDGGNGGHGGGGGGGAGGPSIGIFKLTSFATVAGSSTVTSAASGWGGEGGTGPPSTGRGGIGARGIAQPIYPGPAVPTPGQLSWDSCMANDSTQGCVDIPGTPLHSARGVVVSPDGTSVYAASQDSHSLARFIRGGSDGQILAWGGCLAYSGSEGCVAGHALSGPRGVAVSPDGKSVYVANVVGNSVAHLVRNELDGQVAWDDCFANNGLLGCYDLPFAPLTSASAVAVSPDGKSVYVASQGSNSIAHFFRGKRVREDPDGQLAWDGCLANDATQGCGDLLGSPLSGASGVAVSPDGNSVYVVSADSNTIAFFVRSGTNGQIVWGGCLANGLPLPCSGLPGSPLTGAAGVAVSPDGKSVYVVSRVSGSIAHFFRNGTNGQLAWGGCLANDAAQGCVDLPGSPLRGASGVAVSPDGKSVYIASADSNSIAHFARNGPDGQIVYDGCWANDATEGCVDLPGSPLTGARGVALSPDGKSAYVASGGSNSIAHFFRALAPSS